ncbi:hypothetical protein, partial [Bacillus weihaiensis]|uniref:hypothetical protein n=1 Tax=Bacillus weihaiensis TaxID=1547283 RepID=UPI002354CCCA
KATEKYEKSLDDQYRQLAIQIEQILEEEEKSAPSAWLEEAERNTDYFRKEGCSKGRYLTTF